jgi:hypothetical protein
MKNINKIIPAACLLALASCGGSGGSNSTGAPGPTDGPGEEESQAAEGTYKAILRPYNFTVAGWIPNGMTDIKITGDKIEVKSWLDDAANVVHMQNIHFGTQCPTTANDSNRDGFVDFNESVQVSKPILLQLDSDLDSQSELSVYPRGNFTYFQTATLPSMIPLNLEGKVIIVTGAAADRGLPATVSQVNNQTREFSIPIACGVIERMPEIANN